MPEVLGGDVCEGRGSRVKPLYAYLTTTSRVAHVLDPLHPIWTLCERDANFVRGYDGTTKRICRECLKTARALKSWAEQVEAQAATGA